MQWPLCWCGPSLGPLITAYSFAGEQRESPCRAWPARTRVSQQPATGQKTSGRINRECYGSERRLVSAEPNWLYFSNSLQFTQNISSKQRRKSTKLIPVGQSRASCLGLHYRMNINWRQLLTKISYSFEMRMGFYHCSSQLILLFSQLLMAWV